MWRCNHCGGDFPLDDMEIVTVVGTGCCLHCWLCLTENEKPLPAVLRRELERVAGSA